MQPNDRLPQLVAEMVQKGLNASPKVVDPNPTQQIENNVRKEADLFQTNILLEDLQDKPLESPQIIQDNFQFSNLQQHTVQLVQNLPIQGMETIKLELPSHLQHYAQFVVSDVSEPLLMCQSLMLDTAQIIPLSNHTMSSNFVQIHSQNLPNQ